jgi:Bacterial pre-peptidase C-terminal domain
MCNSWKTFVIVLLCCSTAVAAPRLKPRTYSPVAANLKNTCETAVPISVGQTIGAELTEVGDVNYYSVSVDAGQALIIQTILDGSLGDSEMYLYDAGCTTELSYNDDSQGLESVIMYKFTQAGTYKFMVMGYDNSEFGTYSVSVGLTHLDEVGDNCGNVTPIPHGAFSFTATTTDLGDDMAFPLDPDYGGGAPDAMFAFQLGAGGSFTCDITLAGADFVIYLIDRCTDPQSSNDYFSDGDPESLHFVNSGAEPLTMVLVIDGYNEYESGGFRLEGYNDGLPTVSNKVINWGEMKARYR